MNKALPDMSAWTLDQIVEFIDAHDMGEYEEDLEVVQAPQSSMKVVPIRLSVNDLNAIKAIAEKGKIPYTALIREWTKERLEKEKVA